MEQDEILNIIYDDIHEMNEGLTTLDSDSKLITLTVINYAFDLIDRIKGKIN